MSDQWLIASVEISQPEPAQQRAEHSCAIHITDVMTKRQYCNLYFLGPHSLFLGVLLHALIASQSPLANQLEVTCLPSQLSLKFIFQKREMRLFEKEPQMPSCL